MSTEQNANADRLENSLSVLGVAVGDNRYLIPMNEVSEVIFDTKVSCCAFNTALVPWLGKCSRQYLWHNGFGCLFRG